MKKIPDVINYINEVKSSFLDCEDDSFFDDLDPCNFFDKTDLDLIKSYSKIPSARWSCSMLCKSYKVLEKNKENLSSLDIDLDDIEIPDFTSFDLEQSAPKVKLESSRILRLCNTLLVNYKYDILEQFSDTFTIKLSLKNIKELLAGRDAKHLILPINTLEMINLYINSVNHEEEETIDMDIVGYNKTLMPFQQTGCLFGLLNKKILLADEMGLGKTVEALAILKKANAFKAIVICPKSLKYKWELEASYLEGITVEVVTSKTDLVNLTKDIYIINYENVSNYVDMLESNNEIKTIILDESHYLKNPKAKRSKKCLNLSKNKEYVLSLTGSPILNKPSELINQLDTLGSLSLFGGYADFVNKYCCEEKDFKGKYGATEDQKANYAELAERLRSTVYIRREKRDILKDLPEKRRSTIMVDIDDKEYKKALKDYQKETDLKKKKSSLEKLKQLAAAGKYDAIKDRIQASIENKEKLVVFAYHRSMQEKLIADFPNALKIVSSQDEKERFNNANQFQNNDEDYLIICSLRAAYYGFDLFSSSQVLFAEMDWVPEINKQAEDRCHRMGQKNCVNIWYLIAKNTIEEKILYANAEKIKITDQVNKKIDFDEIEFSVVSIKDQVMKLLDED